jgi:hypothetical protein
MDCSLVMMRIIGCMTRSGGQDAMEADAQCGSANIERHHAKRTRVAVCMPVSVSMSCICDPRDMVQIVWIKRQRSMPPKSSSCIAVESDGKKGVW